MEQRYRGFGRKTGFRSRGRGRGRSFGPKPPHSNPSRTSGRQECQNDSISNAEALKETSLPTNSATNRKFEEACAKIQESLQRFSGAGEEENTSEEEEDEVEKDSVLKKVLDSYGGIETDGHLQRTRQFLLDTLNSGSCICLICIESVKRNNSVWSCRGCYSIFHLSCIQKWSKDSIYHQTSSLTNDAIQSATISWCCPKCRHEYTKQEQPQDYYCFCSKEKDPVVDLWLVPHSCGQTCERKLEPYCGHECLLLCHPGPCPPCPKTVYSSCYCGRQKPTNRRCSDKNWSCGMTCSRILECGQHKCTKPCHAGNCETCPHQSKQKCQCGQESRLMPCASPEWKCSKICGKKFPCGFHQCEQVCHKGACGECPRSKSRYCPCGKTLMDLPCTEDIPTCGDTCDKLLECGVHKCIERCHFGNCGTCLQMRVKKCRCGAKEKSVPCSKEYTCETKCKKIRDCKKHPCNRKCCDGNCPSCEQLCGRTLNCKNHKCSSRCHRGPCYPCRQTATVTCRCGLSKIVVPCGRQKTTKPPKCKLPCKIPPDCNHEFRDPHKCHFGNCPPCQQICNKELENCKHICPAVCHIAVLTMVIPSQKRIGPWEPIQVPYMEVQTKPCPPCKIPISVICLGGHEASEFPCAEVRDWSCGRICGRLLECRNHSCSLECHKVENAPSAYEAGDTCQPCEERCKLDRPKGCTHRCNKPCHPRPCSPCRKHHRIRCHCQLNWMYIMCVDWTDADDQKKEEMLSCQNRCPKELTCGHRCPEVCHPRECPSSEVCKKKVAVRCQCKRIKREFPCNILCSQQIVVECDTVCEELKEKARLAQLIEEEKKREEEMKKQQEELNEFWRKREGKKRKPRKIRETEDEVPWWKIHWKKLAACGVCSIIIGIYIALS